ncbi:MAG TPA: glycerol-3-phosphate acyltransferase [Halanaerobiales bacterium]|nr:glycerol-3-phosphate acyltransferase [Halanaerobiales bacterium]
MEIFMVIFSYLFGSLSFAQVLASKKNIQLNKVGTKNPGAYNVYSEIGHKWGMTSGAFDIFKGALPVFIGRVILNCNFTYLVLITAAAVMGHIWPVYFKFHGGRGLATSLGTLFVFDFYLAFFALIIAGIIGFWFRFLSKRKPRISLMLFPLYILSAYYLRANINLVIIGFVLMIIIYIKAIQLRYRTV